MLRVKVILLQIHETQISQEGLGIIRRFLDELHALDITYCHWKSNEHLDASMQGDTDLDILFDNGQRSEVERVLVDNGFKYYESVTHASYVGIVDYIGMDPETTKIVHVHAHFQLTIGEKFLKGYHVPWERLLLSTRRWDPRHAIYVSDPGLEAVLLLTREALKYRLRDNLRLLAGMQWMDRNSTREMRWLLERVDKDEVANTVRGLGAPERVVTAYLSVLHSNLRYRTIFYFIRTVKQFLRPHRMFHPSYAFFYRTFREVRSLVLRILRRLKRTFPSPVPLRRVRPKAGRIIAFVGTDGSGKSSAVASTSKWLRSKLDVLTLYLGSGQGPGTISRRLLRGLRIVWSKNSSAQERSVQSPNPNGDIRRRGSRNSFFWMLFRLCWAVLLVREQRRKLRLAHIGRERGMIVLTDRYPQNQVFGFNDGPLLSPYRDHKNRLVRWIANWELNQHADIAETFSPDLVIRLHVTPQIAAIRKPEMTVSATSTKQNALFSVDWPNSLVATVDADQEIQEVVRDIRTVVWKQL